MYKDDLGLVEFIQGSKKALVRLIPRIRSEVDNDTGTCKLKLVTKYSKGESRLISVPQKFFNPTLVKSDCRKEKYGPKNKSFYRWQDQLFRNGFLYLMVPIGRLQAERVNPRLEEVQTFQSASKANGGSGAAASMDDFLSDEDEWDILDDETLKKTIDDIEGGCSALKRLDLGDNVEAVSGQYKSIKG